MSNTDFGYGQQTPDDAGSQFNAIRFLVRQFLAENVTAKLVQVKKVTGGGEGNPAGTVDVLPLVQQIDGNGYGTAHGVVYKIPWFRIQGGKNAIICDPQVGDVGFVVAQDRDISTVKNQPPGFSTDKGFLPASRRRFSISDGIYVGGALNVTPEQYLIFTTTGFRLIGKNGNSVVAGASGVTISDSNGNQIVMQAGSVNVITPVFQVNGVPVTVP